MSLLNKALGIVLKRYRERKGWTQDVLAQELDISRATVVYYEQGTQSPSLEVVHRASQKLGFSLEEIQKELKNLESSAGMNAVPEHLKKEVASSLEKIFPKEKK